MSNFYRWHHQHDNKSGMSNRSCTNLVVFFPLAVIRETDLKKVETFKVTYEVPV